jgi:hypothetical protein
LESLLNEILKLHYKKHTHVNFSQQTDGERLRDVSWQAVLGIAAPDRLFG